MKTVKQNAASLIEKSIRENFPGRGNAAIRRELRRAQSGSDVRAMTRFVAFSARGLASLEEVAAAVDRAYPRPASDCYGDPRPL